MQLQKQVRALFLRSDGTVMTPVVVEGRGGRDHRDAFQVTAKILSDNAQLFATPVMIVTQGDPPSQRGVAPISNLMAEHLGSSKIIVAFDEEHFDSSDRHHMAAIIPYQVLRAILAEAGKGTEACNAAQAIDALVDGRLEEMNVVREARGMPALPEWFRDFAVLQEVTKAALKQSCGALKLVHTGGVTGQEHEFTVTSFYVVNLQLGLLNESDVVYFKPSAQL